MHMDSWRAWLAEGSWGCLAALSRRCNIWTKCHFFLSFFLSWCWKRRIFAIWSLSLYNELTQSKNKIKWGSLNCYFIWSNNWIFKIKDPPNQSSHCHSSTELLANFLIHAWDELKYAVSGRKTTCPTTSSLNSCTTRKWILNDWRHSEPWDEPHMQENTDRAGVCRSSEVTAQVIKDAALYAIFPGLVSFLQSVGVWSHSWFRAPGMRVCVCECVWGACAF